MTVSTAVRKGSALVGIAGIMVLAGCSANADAGDAPSTSPSESPSSSSGGDGSATYKDGAYTAEGSYQTPETVEKISVTLTLAGGIVTDVKVTGEPQARETKQYQGEFIAGISDVVKGKSISDLSVSHVAGSSLTSSGFNKAVEAIKEQAAG